MKIYISHSSSFDFQNELYAPLKTIELVEDVELIFPHNDSAEPFALRDNLDEISGVFAEISYPSTGQGMELAWIHAAGIPIIGVSKEGMKYSTALKLVVGEFYTYENADTLKSLLNNFMKTL